MLTQAKKPSCTDVDEFIDGNRAHTQFVNENQRKSGKKRHMHGNVDFPWEFRILMDLSTN